MSSSSVTAAEDRPTWRGWMHVGAFALAIPGGLLLILVAHSATARVAACIYAASLLLGFGTSAGYHRLAKRPRTQAIMQRLDHSMIFVLIAGSYTPICLLGLPTAWGIPLLCVVWAGALAGILIKQFAFEKLKVLEYALYPILGWALVVATPALLSHMTALELSLLLAGGLLYTIGIPVLVRERPDPWPRTFGYHEIWHTFTVAAGACHFLTIGLLVRG
ncbi:MAG: hemolysin III family protein [Actinobacteria bacterium]|nr:hemolysin III family protein [Actinomycetota bacterium]MSW76252.1 hemolysin III family protein [Actinomycetota bacterium]MSX56500.1 hemolysin III family protein [Actinomycetota bacterium]MSX92160.1 hemolysin III family protein [Actinomycetota bacterium]MSZ81962.1 hemolysin III family protein [Actinomycetota bacterium]